MQFWRESQISLNQWELSILVTATFASLAQESLHNIEANEFLSKSTNNMIEMMKFSRKGTLWLPFWKMLPGWTTSFGRSFLNTVGTTYNSALKYAADHFELVFASILASENRVYPLHLASSLSLSSTFYIQSLVNFYYFLLFFNNLFKK